MAHPTPPVREHSIEDEAREALARCGRRVCKGTVPDVVADLKRVRARRPEDLRLPLADAHWPAALTRNAAPTPFDPTPTEAPR